MNDVLISDVLNVYSDGDTDGYVASNSLPNYNITIPNNFINEAKKLIPYENYIGFSITAGHPTRVKEIN